MLEKIARKLPWSIAWRATRMLLRSQGIGAGADVAVSGEQAVFDLVPGPRPVLFDVGGHVGEYSDAFLKRFPGGEVVLFEPSASHMSEARARLGDNVDYLQVAVSDREGSATLYKDADISGLASLTRRDLGHRDVVMNLTETVQCRTLDSIVAERGIGRIDLLKIDVEGHELDVLRGAAETFASGKIGVVQFEFGGCNLDTRTTLKDFFALFERLGFALHLVRPAGDLARLGRYDEALEQYQTTNYVAVPKATQAARAA